MKKLLALSLLLGLAQAEVGVKETATGNKWKIDSNGNGQVRGPTTPSQSGYTKIAGKDGSPMKVTATGYPEVSLDSFEFFDTIDGAAVNTNLWTTSTSTMTVTQAAGFINVNAAASTTASAYAIISTIQNFYLSDCIPLHVHLRAQSSLWNLPANTVAEFGWGTVATTAAPTDGMLLRVRAGVMYAVMNYGGSETELALTPTYATMPTVNATNEWVIDFYANEMRIYADGTLIAASTTPDGNPTTMTAPTVFPASTTNNRQPLFLRVYNTGSSPASSPTMKLGQVSVQHRNANFGKPLADKLVGMGRGGYQGPVTLTQTPNHANSTSPTSATLSNTAAGYATLGGRYQFAAPASAATDFALFAYQVPVGYQMFCDSITITAMNTGANVTTTATVLDWSLGVNSSAVSLATADGAGTWAPRRVPLGMHGFPIYAAGPPASGGWIGYRDDDITRPLHVAVDSGRYLHVIVQAPVGTATASQVMRGDVQLNCWFE